MPILEWYKFPVDVKQSVRTIPVQVTLPAGVLPADLQIVAAQTSPNVTLYTENSAVVSAAVPAPAPANTFEVYLSVSTIDDHDIWVANQINPEAKQSIVVTLRDSVSGVTSIPIYIKVAPIPADVVATEKTLFADDFSGATINRENWTAWRTVAGVQAAPNMTVAVSHLSLNNAAVAAGITAVRSDVIEGRCHIEFRGAIESIRRQNAGFAFGAYFVDLEATAIADLDLGTAGFLGFGINLTAGLVFANDPATTIHISTASSTTDLGPDIPIVLPAGGVTTTAHTYSIDFDGHTAIFSVDGTVVATVTVKIPPTTAKRFIVWMTNRTDAAPPAGVNLLAFDRIDVASDERLVTTSAAGGGGGAVVTVTTGGLVESQPAPNPSSERGATSTPLVLEPDHALRTRARALTVEESFIDDFLGAALSRAVTGNVTLTSGSTAWSRAAATTPLRVGDYLFLDADTYTYATQIDTIAAGGLSGTLRTVYPAAGGGTGAASVRSYFEEIVDAGVVGVAEAVAASVCTLTMPNGTVANDLISLARALGAGGRKAGQPVEATVWAGIDNRRANQGFYVGIADAPTLAAATMAAWFVFDGADPDTTVRVETSSAPLGADTLTSGTITIPNNRHTTEVLPYTVRLYEEFALFLSGDFILGGSPIHLPDPFAPLYLFVILRNIGGAPAGATVVSLNQVAYNNYNSARTQVEQPDAAKLLASTYERTAFATGTPRAPTNIADNLVHEITDPAGHGMDFWRHYVAQQIGGDDICFYMAAAAPAVATCRRGFHLRDSIPWAFSPTAPGLRLWAVKAVDGTANCDVTFCAVDGGAGA